MEVENRMSELVTVIIPVYNTVAVYLEECVQSVMQQTFRDFYIILVNDCSTDMNTVDCLHKIEKLYPEQVQIINFKKNVGISSSRNYGIEHANGKWICFLDHDDYWESNYLEEMLKAVSDDDVEIVLSGFKKIDNNGKVIGCFPDMERVFVSEYFPYSTSAPWNRLIKRQFLIDRHIRYPDGCLVEDIPFNIWCNITANKIVVTETYGYCNRIDLHSTSRSVIFEQMPFDKMPFDTLQYICLANQTGGKKRKICDGAIMEVVTLLTCLFCRKSPKETIEKAAEASAILVRGNMRHYISSSLQFIFYVNSRTSVKLLQLGFAIAVFFHIEKIYCVSVAKSLSVIV